jgi:hypothetical protein
VVRQRFKRFGWCGWLWLSLHGFALGAPCGKLQPANGGALLQFTVTSKATGCTYRYQVIYTEVFGVPGAELWRDSKCLQKPQQVTVPSGFTVQEYLQQLCGIEWWYSNLGSLATSEPAPLASPLFLNPAVSSATTLAPVQASQGTASGDLNGDGIPDLIFLNSTGITVELLNSDGSVLSTNQFSTGFSPDPDNSTIVVADFNGDHKLDLAASNPATDGSGPGSVAILLGNGNGTFQTATSIQAGPNPASLAAADFNDDGKTDLAAASQSSAIISVLTGNGNGTFGTPVSYATGGDSQSIPSSILAVDLNNDGHPDLAVANRGYVSVANSSISALLNTGGSFSQSSVTPLPLPLLPDYLAAADLNHDSNLDLIAVSQNASGMIVLSGKGNGTFQPLSAYATGNSPASIAVQQLPDGNSLLIVPDQITDSFWFSIVSPEGAVGAPPLNLVGGAPEGIAIADLNGDGEPDAVVTGGSQEVAVLLSNGKALQAPVAYSPGVNAQAVAIGDVTGHGDLDVVAAGSGISVLPGNGHGALKSGINTPLTQTAESIALADFNRDGKLDVVVALNQGFGSGPGQVEVLLGNGNGTFQTPVTLTVSGMYPEAVATGDLNGDGIPDVAGVMVSGIGASTTLAVFLSKSDGTFQNARTFAMQSVAGAQSSLVIADFNHDGKPDIAAVSDGTSQTIDVLLGDGRGNFTEAPVLPVTEENLPVSLAAEDVNGDGNPVLFVAHCCGQTDVTYFQSNGDGTFQAEQQLASGSSPMAIAATRSGALTTIFSADNVGAVTAVSLVAQCTWPSSPALSFGIEPQHAVSACPPPHLR